MKRITGRWFAWFVVVFLLWPLTAPALYGQSGELYVTVTAGSPSPNPAVADQEITVTLTAEAHNPPTGSYGCEIYPPTWQYIYWYVEYADDPAGPWGTPPPGASWSVDIDPPPSQNPSVTTLRASFSQGGYWRIVGLEAQVNYTDSCTQSWWEVGVADEIYFTVVEVDLSPDPVYVNVGGSALLTATVTPAEEASSITFETTAPSTATVEGAAPYLTIIGVAEGTTQVQAKLGSEVLASADVHVVTVSYTPDSGPIFTRVVFSSSSPQATFFSANTKVEFEGVFEPDTFSEEHWPPGEYITATHEGVKVSFDPSKPNEIAVAVADVFPSELTSSSEPGVAMALKGEIRGLATLIDGEKSCTVDGLFEITSAYAIGRINNGQFEELSFFDVWTVTSASDFVGVDPETFLYGQIIRPVNEFTDPPPSTLTAQIKTFLSDGSALNSGISMEFVLVSSTSSTHTYQTVEPFILMDNPSFEGDQGELIGVLGDDGYVQIVRMPP